MPQENAWEEQELCSFTMCGHEFLVGHVAALCYLLWGIKAGILTILCFIVVAEIKLVFTKHLDT